MPAKQKQRRKGKRNPVASPFTFKPIANMRINCLFVSEFSITESAAGAGAYRFYRLNGVYDPDTTVGSASAIGFNNYAQLFFSYRVVEVNVELRGVVACDGAYSCAAVSLVPNSRQETLPSNPGLWSGMTDSLSTVVAPKADGGHNVAVLRRRYLPHKLLKITKSQYSNEADYSSLVSTNPVRQLFLAVCVNGISTSSVATLSGLFRISYTVEFFEPALLA